jgi:hypothetical protein
MAPERDERDAADSPDRELLSAYVDGVAELSPDERRRVEARLARDPQVRAEETAVRGLIDQLRALPPAGNEPDWAAMERSIRDAVGPEVPRVWWRRWQWLVPLSTCVTAAAVLFALWSRAAPRDPSFVGPTVQDARPERPARPEGPERVERDADLVPLWLDGTEVDVDPSASDLLGPTIGEDDVTPPDAELGALLPPTNLGWVDHLDDAAVDRAERWLATVDTTPVQRPSSGKTR